MKKLLIKSFLTKKIIMEKNQYLINEVLKELKYWVILWKIKLIFKIEIFDDWI